MSAFFGLCLTQLASWAEAEFALEVARPASTLRLARACMLLALEERAAEAADHGADVPSGATASTWSLARLDALAEEAAAVLVAAAPPGTAAGKPGALAAAYPMQALQAVNDVLFLRHGYTACNRHGAARHGGAQRAV